MDGKEDTKGAGTEEENKDGKSQEDNSAAGNGNQKDGGNGHNHMDDDKDDGQKKERSFSQEQVNRMMAREKNQGRAAAFKELGIDPKDTKMVKMFQAFVESQKTEEQKAAEKDIELQSKQAEAERRATVAEAKAEAMMLGIKSQYVDDAVTLAMSKMSDDNSDLKTVLNELKEKYSFWCNDSDDGNDGKKGGKVGQKGTGASIKDTGKKSGGEAGSLGTRLAAQRKTANGKTSYWGGRR